MAWLSPVSRNGVGPEIIPRARRAGYDRKKGTRFITDKPHCERKAGK